MPSSMETVPTDMVDGFGSDEDATEADGPGVWGRLFPIGSSFTALDLVKEQYTFGRGDSCDYQFKSAAMRKHPCFQAYSKLHFTIVQEKTSTGTHVFLIDMSSNGTFVNGEKVGKGCKQVMGNNDEIGLALPRNKAFIYMDGSSNDDSDLPDELRQRYTLSRVLGKGACGEVKLAFEKGSCKKVAVKIIQKKKFSAGGRHQQVSRQVMTEVNIMKSLKHPCIIQFENLIDTSETLYIILELVEGGELFDRVVQLGKLDESTAKLFFYQMALAIKYLHDQDITHRDLKPENILLVSDSHETLVKVTDFGLSKFVDGQTMLKTFCGTPTYLAPEILLTAGTGTYTKAIDCWSLGVILYICLVGYPPFSPDRKDMELGKQITGGHYEFPKAYWSNVSTGAIDLVKKLLCVNVKKRLTVTDALNHPWLKDEGMRRKAAILMHPGDGMLPPQTDCVPKKRKGDSDEHSPTKKKTPAK